MRYIGKVYRPPSEADAYLLQATIGCSWNKCTYCDMYRDKPKFSLRNLDEVLEDMRMAAANRKLIQRNSCNGWRCALYADDTLACDSDTCL